MSFAKLALENGGSIHPLIIPAHLTNGTGIMNPSVFVDGDKILVNLRHVNYTFYHSEEKLFQHQFGPLTYVHPEHDMHLRTDNYYLELNDNFEITRYNKVDTSKFDTYEPQWEFVGLEDARIFRWEDKLYLSGVRRDTTTNGEGRMELSEIVVKENTVEEVSRFRIPPPNDPNSYCEKNWMPFLDIPYHYVKWSNPTEVVKVDPEKQTSQTVHMGEWINLPRDLRGGSQIITSGDYYITITHEVDLFNSEVGRKDAVYRHRFVVWDKKWNMVKYSKDFSFMTGHVEFCVGLAEYKDDVLITFSFQDNAAYLLRCPFTLIEDFINEQTIRSILPINKESEEFDWGNNPQEMPGIIGPEIFLNRIYEKIVEIEEGDIVVDIGANVGAFGYSIKDKNVKMIYCVEPSNSLVDTLAKNLKGMPVTIINRAISNDTDDNKKLIGPHNIYGNIGDTYKTITFKKLIEDYNISHIDFLKIDCEGGEYEVFTEENRDYILNNVKNVAGEWHFLNEGTVERFKNFRDRYLKGYEYKVFDRYNNDVSEEILDNQYLIHYERFHRESLDGQFMIYISYDTPVLNNTPTFTFHSNPRPALWVVDNFYDDPYAVRDFALKQEYNQGGLGKGFIGKRSCEQFLFPGLREAFQKITGFPITRWEEHGMNGRFQSTIAGEPNVYHSDEQTWAAAIYLTPDAPYNAGTSLIAHKPTGIRHSSHPEAYKMWSDPNTYDIHLDSSPWEKIDVAANVFNRLVIWNAHCPHAAGEYFGDTLDTSRLIHLFFFD